MQLGIAARSDLTASRSCARKEGSRVFSKLLKKLFKFYLKDLSGGAITLETLQNNHGHKQRGTQEEEESFCRTSD